MLHFTLHLERTKLDLTSSSSIASKVSFNHLTNPKHYLTFYLFMSPICYLHMNQVVASSPLPHFEQETLFWNAKENS